MLFHNAASSVICQVLFAKQYHYEDEFMKFSVGLFHETSKIINGRWGMVCHTQSKSVGNSLVYNVITYEPFFFSFIQIYDSIPMVRRLPLPFRKAFTLFRVGYCQGYQ